MNYIKANYPGIAKAIAEGRISEVRDDLRKIQKHVDEKGREKFLADKEVKRADNAAAVRALNIGDKVVFTGQTSYQKDAAGTWIPVIKSGAVGVVKSKGRRTRIGVDFGPYGYFAWLIDRVAPAPADAQPDTEVAKANPMETVLLDVFSAPATR